jgi:hypothetical protein
MATYLFLQKLFTAERSKKTSKAYSRISGKRTGFTYTSHNTGTEVVFAYLPDRPETPLTVVVFLARIHLFCLWYFKLEACGVCAVSLCWIVGSKVYF